MEEETKSGQDDVNERLRELRASVQIPAEETSTEVEAAYVPIPSLLDQLQAKDQVQEQPFTSDVPILGPLITRFRQAWNNISTTWYVRPLLQQQNEFNHLMVQYIRSLELLNEEIDARLIDIDRDETALARQVAQLNYALSRLENVLEDMERQTSLPGDGSSSGATLTNEDH